MRGKKGVEAPDFTNVKARKNRVDAAGIKIPKVKDPDARKRALEDPIFFIEHCCRASLRHNLPPALRDFVLQVVQSTTSGSNNLCIMPRGSGKTTLLVGSLLYCIVKGIVRFPVVVGANQKAADGILKNIWRIVETSDELDECFPELTTPVRELAGRWQRGAYQHIDGQLTHIAVNRSNIHFADVNGVQGADIVARGAGSSVRGLLANGTRPDWVICDDLQKSSTARSETALSNLEHYILEDLRGLGGSDSRISLFIAATPLAPNDIVDRLSRRSDFITIRKPLVLKWPARRELWEDYTTLLYGDLASGTEEAHKFYLSNRAAMDEGAEMLDPLAYPPGMESALERAYYLRATMGEPAFRQEYLLVAPTPRESMSLDPAEVSKRLSYVPHRVVPRNTPALVAAIDVGTATSLSVAILAFGKHQIGTVVDAFKFPDNGRLAPKGIPQEQTDRIIAKALVGVISNLVAPGRYRQEATGKPVPIVAVAVDRGYRTSIVDSVAAYFLRRRVQVYPCKGSSNLQYRPGRNTLGKADNCDLREQENGPRWLAYNADALKVVVLQAFNGEPLTTGALSLWGDDSAKVFPVAKEIAGEKLLETFDTRAGTVYRWAASSLGASNHFLDAIVMGVGLGNWMRFREPDSVKSIIRSPTEVPAGNRREEAATTTNPPPIRTHLQPRNRINLHSHGNGGLGRRKSLIKIR